MFGITYAHVMPPSDTVIKRQLSEAASLAQPLAAACKSNGSLPKILRPLIDKWKFGQYGWTSPTNLFLTAAWLKWLDPTQDVCRIWSRNESGPIKGGYSIRSMDEGYTVPLVQSLGIAPGFCSPNSGMQGTRAIEKSRGYSRLDKGVKLEQRVLFDLDLFINIMNTIDSLSANDAKAAFVGLLGIGIECQEKRTSLSVAVTRDDKSTSDFICRLSSLASVADDPQLVTIIVAGALQLLFGPRAAGGKLEVLGAGDAMTAANAQSGRPGDLAVCLDGSLLAAAEAKGSSIRFGVKDVRNALDRAVGKVPNYMLVTAASTPWEPDEHSTGACSQVITEAGGKGVNIAALTVRDLLVLVSATQGVPGELVYKTINEHMKTAKGLRGTALTQWKEFNED